ncbi:hypothetical protein PsorP6_010113 [Peronosclerospora sorghi]|uniref:Uncharacterized protein n=1 Tax=Peronosclerospora sorghi TaxID=230839 RepID=A0ACC0VW21_9STRA|nr:hypothetical protein PsorP6_010113 [Peronosclerospora sorghi]
MFESWPKTIRPYPIRGHVINVHNPKLNKQITFLDKENEHTHIIPRPNGDVILGGTVQEHNWSTDNMIMTLKIYGSVVVVCGQRLPTAR